MAFTGYGLWLNDPNTKFPGLTHWLSFRMQLATTGTTQTTNLPDQGANAAQLIKVNPSLPNSQPQQGRRFFPYLWVVRDPSGVLSPSGSTTPASVSLIDVTQANATVATLSSTAGASSPLVQYQTLTSAPVVINPYDQLAVTFTQPAGATSTCTGFTVDLQGYWQQGI